MAQPAIPVSRVVSASGGRLVRGDGGATFSSVSIDSRTVQPGALFVAVKGDRFDGHDFAAGAVASGATGVIVERGRAAALGVEAAIVEVDDTVTALGKIGRAQLESVASIGGLKVVGITGSNGKTTTKEMVAAILASAAGPDAVLKTEGNLNNHLGVPLTLCRLHAGHRYAVVEMGMSGLGEIRALTKLATPHVAVITNIAGVHLEQLGSVESIARAKAEIFEALRETAVYPANEPLLAPYVASLPRTMTFGPKAARPTVGYDDVTLGPTGLTMRLHLSGVTSAVGVSAHVPLIGRHNASNAAAAACVALALDIGEGSILDGLANVQPAKHRAQLVQAGDRTILDDCYNAAPNSMRAALDALVEITPPGAQKIAVLGDMLELGPDSAKLHAEVGAYAAARADHLIAVGAQSKHMNASFHTEDVAAAVERVRAVSRAGDVILVKASRGMRLERVIDSLVEKS